MFVPHIGIKLLFVLGRAFCFCFIIVYYYLHCVSWVYICSSCCDKAAVRSGEGALLLVVHCLLLPPFCRWGLCLFLML